MSDSVKKPKLKRDWKGRKVRTLRDLRNGWGVIPAGTVFEVRENWAGLNLLGDRCTCCGLRASINRVPEHDVELLP